MHARLGTTSADLGCSAGGQLLPRSPELLARTEPGAVPGGLSVQLRQTEQGTWCPRAHKRGPPAFPSCKAPVPRHLPDAAGNLGRQTSRRRKEEARPWEAEEVQPHLLTLPSGLQTPQPGSGLPRAPTARQLGWTGHAVARGLRAPMGAQASVPWGGGTVRAEPREIHGAAL